MKSMTISVGFSADSEGYIHSAKLVDENYQDNLQNSIIASEQ